MTKREYAEAIANKIGGEVQEVEKANGIIYTGITKREEGSNISPTVYIDDLYKNDVQINEASARVATLLAANTRKNIDMTIFTDFEKVKPNLRARLYNEKTNGEVKKSAKRYGFPNLMIIPYINIDEYDGTISAAKVTKQLVEQWGVTEKEVIDIAIQNSTKEIEIKTMLETMRQMMTAKDPTISEEMLSIMFPTEDTSMYVISNKSKTFGAIGVITAKRKLNKLFPNGYVILPSSIHEVFVVSIDNMTEEELTRIVQEVNSTEVDEAEQLSDRVYIFAK